MSKPIGLVPVLQIDDFRTVFLSWASIELRAVWFWPWHFEQSDVLLPVPIALVGVLFLNAIY